MIYLKTFEDVEKYRKDTTLVNIEYSQKILSGLKHFDDTDYPILRGARISEDVNQIFIINPKKHKRISAYTNNYYTWIIDKSKYWKDYPKRSK